MQIGQQIEYIKDAVQQENQEASSQNEANRQSKSVEDGYYEIEKIIDYRVEAGN